MTLSIPTREASPSGTLAAAVLTQLRNDIVSCKLQPGAQLRFEMLKADYGASFSTLREGLTALTLEGLVISEGQRGFRVAAVSTDDLLDLTEARVLIERELLKLAIEKGADDWEVAVAASFHRMALIEGRLDAKAPLSPEWKSAHKQFHASLVAASGSPVLLSFRNTLFVRAERYRSLSTLYRSTKRNKIKEHEAIMDAALRRKVPVALRLIDEHIRSTTENVLTYARKVLAKDMK